MTDKPAVEAVTLADIQPDAHNANRGTERGTFMIRRSLEKLGAGRSILLDSKGRIIAGNKTAEAAGDIGLDDVLIVRTRGDKLVAVLREDLDLDDPAGQARELAYADNRAGQVSLDWEPAVIQLDIAAGVDLSDWWQPFELEAFSVDDDDPSPEDAATITPETARASLADRFVVPPFSVLDARQGYWQNRKRAWISLGIESELGRGVNLGDVSATVAGISDPEAVAACSKQRRELPGKGGTLGAIAPNEGGENGILTSPGKYATEKRGGTHGARNIGHGATAQAGGRPSGEAGETEGHRGPQ